MTHDMWEPRNSVKLNQDHGFSELALGQTAHDIMWAVNMIIASEFPNRMRITILLVAVRRLCFHHFVHDKAHAVGAIREQAG